MILPCSIYSKAKDAIQSALKAESDVFGARASTGNSSRAFSWPRARVDGWLKGAEVLLQADSIKL